MKAEKIIFSQNNCELFTKNSKRKVIYLCCSKNSEFVFTSLYAWKR